MDICCKAGISQATYFNWKKYDGLLPTEMRRMKLLEDENEKLRKLVADLSLDREMLQDVIRRKLQGLLASASWSPGCVSSGTCRSGGRVGFSRSTHPPITIHRIGTIRPDLKPESRRSAPLVFAKAIVACTLCCAGRIGP